MFEYEPVGYLRMFTVIIIAKIIIIVYKEHSDMSIKDYELLSKLGAGSFGVVHKAREKKTNNIVVIKMISISNLNARARKSVSS